MSKSTFPKLEAFLGAYFHQDWALDDPDSETVVAGYLERTPARTVKAVIAELTQLEARKLKEAALREVLGNLGSYFDPAAERKTHEQWLRWLRKALEAGASEK